MPVIRVQPEVNQQSVQYSPEGLNTPDLIDPGMFGHNNADFRAFAALGEGMLNLGIEIAKTSDLAAATNDANAYKLRAAEEWELAKEQNPLDLSAQAFPKYQEKMAKVAEEIKQKSKIKYGIGQRDFDNRIKDIDARIGLSGVEFEFNQQKEYRNVTLNDYTNSVANDLNAGKTNLGDAKASVDERIELIYGSLESGFAKEQIKKQQYGKLVGVHVETLVREKKFDEALSVLGEHADLFEAAALAALKGNIGEYKQAENLQTIIGEALALYPNDPIKAKEYYDGRIAKSAAGDYPYDEKSLVFQPGISLDGLNENSKYGLSNAFNYAQSLGIPTVQISSTVRSPERNAAVGGVPNSAHQGDSAGDIVLLDESGNALPESDPRVQKTIANAKADGWTEVLYHDAGSGLHLHLGGYKGKGKTPGRKVSALEKAASDNTFYSALTQREKLNNYKNATLRSSLLDELFILERGGNLNGTSVLDTKNKVLAESGLNPDSPEYAALNSGLGDLAQNIAALPKESDPTMYNTLYDKRRNGSLQISDVHYAVNKKLISQAHAQRFFKSIIDNADGRQNAVNNNADAVWEKRLDEVFPLLLQTYAKVQIKAVIRQELEDKNIVGDFNARIDFANKIIDAARGDSLSVINKYKIDAQLGEKAQAQFGAEGEKTWELIVAGQMKTYPGRQAVDKGEAAKVADYIANLMIQSKTPGSAVYGDPSYEAAWSYLVNTGKPITIEAYNESQRRLRDDWHKGRPG